MPGNILTRPDISYTYNLNRSFPDISYTYNLNRCFSWNGADYKIDAETKFKNSNNDYYMVYNSKWSEGVEALTFEKMIEEATSRHEEDFVMAGIDPNGLISEITITVRK